MFPFDTKFNQKPKKKREIIYAVRHFITKQSDHTYHYEIRYKSFFCVCVNFDDLMTMANRGFVCVVSVEMTVEQRCTGFIVSRNFFTKHADAAKGLRITFDLLNMVKTTEFFFLEKKQKFLILLYNERF